jgi:hypothetical protein
MFHGAKERSVIDAKSTNPAYAPAFCRGDWRGRLAQVSKPKAIAL